MVITPEQLRRASKTRSLSGDLCQLSGSLLAVAGGFMTVGAMFNGGGLPALLLGGSASLALALAGAPVAALGSIANSQKVSKELLLLDLKDRASDPTPEWPAEAQRPVRTASQGGAAGAPPPPPPPPSGLRG